MGASGPEEVEMTPPESRSRIRRVETGLLSIPALRSEPPRRLDLAERMAQLTVPGVSVAVADGYELVWARGHGAVETDRDAPVTPDTLFLAGSISKPVTAAAVLRLVEQGRLDLDADVNETLTSWRVPANGDWRPRLTLRQLLSHSAGLTVHGFPGYPRDQVPPTLVQVLDGLAPANTPPVRVTALPGTQMRYSGGGYCVVQQLLVDATSTPFPRLLRELVLEPLGMARSTFENPLPEARRGEAATGHRAGGKPVSGGWHVYPEMAAAGLWTTPADLCRFALALQRALAGRDESFLSRRTVAEMLSPQVEEGIGLGLFRFRGGAWFGHGGGDEGFVCQLTAAREGGRAAAVMTNSDRPASLIEEVIRGIAAEYAWPGYLPPPPAPDPAPAPAADAAACAGAYELRPGYRLRVTATGGRLALHPPGQPAMALLPEAALSAAAPGGRSDELAFSLPEVDAEVRFQRTTDGAIGSLTLHQNGRSLPAPRVP
jgi:CubicO group peptidase (beta-lactamase class C family)